MEIYSRRELLTKGLKTAAAVGLGAGMLGTLGDRFSIIDKAWANFDPKALTYQAEETCVLTCTSTLGPCYYSTGLRAVRTRRVFRRSVTALLLSF